MTNYRGGEEDFCHFAATPGNIASKYSMSDLAADQLMVAVVTGAR